LLAINFYDALIHGSVQCWSYSSPIACTIATDTTRLTSAGS